MAAGAVPNSATTSLRRWRLAAILLATALVVVTFLATVPLVSRPSLVSRDFSFQMDLPKVGIEPVQVLTYCNPSNVNGNAPVSFIWNTSDGRALNGFVFGVVEAGPPVINLYNLTNASSEGFSFYSLPWCEFPMEYVLSSPLSHVVTVQGQIIYRSTTTVSVL